MGGGDGNRPWPEGGFSVVGLAGKVKGCGGGREKGVHGGCVGVTEREGERSELIGLGLLECG